MDSSLNQTSVAQAVGMVYTVINEEMCKLPGGPDPSKIFVGGLSMGSLLTAATMLR
jgi:hypothetical protein